MAEQAQAAQAEPAQKSPEQQKPSKDPKAFFGTTPIPRLFLTAALPGAISMLVSSVYDVVDGCLVGNFIGDTSFAAINIAMPFVIILFAFGDLIGAGSAVPISHALGENRDDDANNIFTCSCVFNVLSGAAIGLVLWCAAPFIFTFMGASEELAQEAATYLRVYAVFAPLNTVCYAFDNYLRICGKIRWSFFANVFLASFGAVLEFIMLGVLHQGIAAAAFSYSLAISLTTFISAWPFRGKKLQLKFVRPHFTFQEMWRVFTCGLSTFFDNIAGQFTTIVINGALLPIGGEGAVNIWGIAMYAEVIVGMLTYGTIDAVQPAVSYNWGARKLKRVRQLEYCCFGTAAFMAAIYIVLVHLFTEPLIHLFIPDADAALLSMGVYAIRLIALSFGLRWYNYATQLLFTALGEAKAAAISALFSACIFPVSVICILTNFGLNALWHTNLIAVTLSAILNTVLFVRFIKKMKQNLALEAA